MHIHYIVWSRTREVYSSGLSHFLSSVLLFVDEADAFLRKSSTVSIVTVLCKVFHSYN